MRLSVLGALVVALAVLSLIIFIKSRHDSRQLKVARDGIAELRAALDQAEILIEGHDGLSLAWTGMTYLLAGRLSEASGVPQGDAETVLRFSDWIQSADAQALTEKYIALIVQGRGFSLSLRTRADAFLRAEGYVTGGYPILFFRGLSREEQSVAQLEGRYAVLAKDHEALWALLDIVEQPVWTADLEKGHLEWMNDAYRIAAEQNDKQGNNRQGTAGHFPNLLKEEAWSLLLQRAKKKDHFRGRFEGYEDVKPTSFSIGVSRVGSRLVCIAYNIGAVEDVRKDMEARSVEYTSALLDSPMAVAIFGADKRLFFHNPAYADLWQADEAWLSSRPLYSEILDAQRRDGHLPEQSDYRSWRTKHFMVLEEAKNEPELWHLPNGRTLSFHGRKNSLGGFTLLYEDITERLDLQSQQKVLMSIQRETLDNLSEGVALFSSDGRLRLFNPAFAQMWQLKIDLLLGSPHIDQIASMACASDGQSKDAGGEERESAWGMLRRSVTALADERHSSRRRLEGGGGRVIDCAIVPLSGGSVLTTFKDITDAVQSESALRERNESLESTEKMRNAFIRHVSYVLRVPLNAVIGYTDLLTRNTVGPLNRKQREYADHILSSSHALLAIINDILDLATLDAGAMELAYAPVDVVAIMRSAADGLRDRLEDNDIDLRIIERGDLSDFMVDGKRLKQILFNLLSNAVTFSGRGGKILLESERQGDEVRISVSDTGRGIPEDAQGLIFRPFEVHSSISGHRGVGLGLSIVRGLVELHGGYVHIISHSGEGTKVTCVFPVSPHVRQPVPPLELENGGVLGRLAASRGGIPGRGMVS